MSDANGNTNGQANVAAKWGGLGGTVVGGLGGLFAAVSSGDATGLSTGLWMLFGSAIVGVITAACAFLVAYLNNATKLQKEIGELRDQISALRVKSDNEIKEIRDKADMESRELRSKLHEAELQERDLKYDLSRAQRRIEILETTAGISHPPAIFGVVIGDFSGTIQEFSPSLTPILGYLPEQMRGESIEKLIPLDMLELHRAKFKEAIKPGVTLDPTKKLNTYALDKDGRRVPVSISLRKWVGETQLITATITLRPSAMAGTHGPNTPQRRSTDV